jgi:hypothetical protein
VTSANGGNASMVALSAAAHLGRQRADGLGLGEDQLMAVVGDRDLLAVGPCAGWRRTAPPAGRPRVALLDILVSGHPPLLLASAWHSKPQHHDADQTENADHPGIDVHHIHLSSALLAPAPLSKT